MLSLVFCHTEQRCRESPSLLGVRSQPIAAQVGRKQARENAKGSSRSLPASVGGYRRIDGEALPIARRLSWLRKEKGRSRVPQALSSRPAWWVGPIGRGAPAMVEGQHPSQWSLVGSARCRAHGIRPGENR